MSKLAPKNRAASSRPSVGRLPSDLNDAEWALVEPMIPPGRRGGRRRSVNVREVLNGIFYVLVDRLPMEGLAEGPAAQEHGASIITLWDWDGTLERIHHALYVAMREAAGREASPTAAIIDQPERQGVLKKGVFDRSAGYDAGKKVKGRKRHILVDTLGLLLGVVVLPADVQDRDGAFRCCVGRDDCFHSSNAYSPMADMPERRWRSSSGAPGLADGDREAIRCCRLRGPAETMDRRTNICVDQPQPPPGS